MRAFPAALLLAFACIYQVVALPLYRAGAVAPDFPFLALVYLSLFAPSKQVLIAAAIAGAALDIFSLEPFGTRLAGYLPALWLLGRFRRTLFAESAFLRIGLTLGACAVAFLLEGAVVAWREGRWLGAWFEIRCALYTALIGVGVHAALDFHRARLGWARDHYFGG